MRIPLFLLVLGSGLTALAAGTNLWPDSDFELSGLVGEARSGTKACHLSVDERVYWRHAGLRKIEVEPFATYELTAWVKGKAEDRPGTALYAYSYNCYGWFNGTGAPVTVQEAADWTRVSRRVTSNRDVIEIAPLVFSSSGPGEFWLDDLTMVQVATPAETIAEITARPNKATNDRQLLMWHHLSRGDVAAATAVIDAQNEREQAELACLLAQRAETLSERRTHLVAMIRWNCTQFPEGHKRLAELFDGYTAAERLAICAEGIRAYPGKNGKVLDCLKQVIAARQMRRTVDFDEDVAVRRSLLPELQKLAAARPGLPWKGVLDEWEKQLAAAEQARTEWQAQQGQCVIRLGGKALSPTEHVIVLPLAATPSERRAAQELANGLERQTGDVIIPVVEEGQEGDRFPILIGRSASLERRGVTVDYAALGVDGIHVELRPDVLVLAGGQRGVLYSVFTFMEEQLGWRWFTDDCTVYPRQGELTPAPFRKVYVPAIAYRMTSSIQLRAPEVCVPLKLNGHLVKADESWGGRVFYRGWVHTFNSLVPRQKYAAEHPEYYSEINGKRVTDERTQLCLTNPDVLRIATETVREWIASSEPGVFAVSVSQNDWHNYCCCAKCQALADHEGSQSGPLLHFVNAIAADIEKDYPDVLIDTLAYQYTRKAPKYVRPSRNVLIRLCSIECCFVHTLADCESNESFREDLAAWSAICPRLFVWDYTINFAHSTQPFPNLRVLKPNLQLYVRHGVTGMYEQGNIFTRGGEFQDLRGYLLSKLLWDQDFDVERGIVEFTDAYYGPAAPYIRQYIDLIHDTIGGDTTKHVRIYASPKSYLDRPEMLAQAAAIFDQAEAAVSQDATYARRVAVARMPLWYTALELGSDAYVWQDNKLKLRDDTDPAPVLQRFEETAAAVGLTKIAESQRRPYADWLEKHRRRLPEVTPVILANNFMRMTVLPEIGGRIWRLQLAGDDRDVFKVFGDSRNGYAPREGGYEEFSTPDYQSPGWLEPYEVVDVGDAYIVLRAKLSNQRQIMRRYELLPDRPGVRVETTMRGSGSLALRTLPAFTMAEPASTVLLLKTKAGTWDRREVATDKTSNIYLRDDLCPDGEWGFWDRKTNLAMLNRFEPEQVDFCYVNSSPTEKRLNLEQWGKAGSSEVRLVNVYEIIPDFKPQW